MPDRLQGSRVSTRAHPDTQRHVTALMRASQTSDDFTWQALDFLFSTRVCTIISSAESETGKEALSTNRCTVDVCCSQETVTVNVYVLLTRGIFKSCQQVVVQKLPTESGRKKKRSVFEKHGSTLSLSPSINTTARMISRKYLSI